MDIRIAASLVDTLRYRLYAQATLPARGEIRVDLMPVVGGVAEDFAPPRRGEAGEAGEAGEPPPALIACPRLTPTERAAALRALRERGYREVQSQLEHFCRTTGRDWQIRKLHYGEPLPQPGVRGQDAAGATRLALVIEVELGACAPTLH